MFLDANEILTVGMVLFAVIDIVGSIPIIVDLKRKHGIIESGKASIVAAVIMLVFLFTGEGFLKIVGIDVNSFAVAGSFVLFCIALEMILGIRIYRDEEANSASIVPIAFPLVAGAGTMTTLLSLRSQYHIKHYYSLLCIEIFFKNRKIIGSRRIGCNP